MLCMGTNWNIIRGHSWKDELYEFSLKYLRDPTVIKNSGMTPKERQLFRNRIKHYKIQVNNNGTDQLVLEDNNIPPYVTSTIYTGTLPVIYKVIKKSNIEPTLRKFLDNIDNHAMSTHTLYDRVIKANFLGISREAVTNFLKQIYLVKKVITTPYKPIIQSFRPTFPFEYWQMDLINLSKITKSNKGYSWILVIVDIFSKFIYLFPLQDNSSISIRNVLQRLFLSGDIPSKLGSDNELAFRSTDVKKLLDHFGVIRILGKPHSPQTQGFVENKNKQIKKSISVYLSKYKTNVYYDMLDSIAFAINNLKHSVTNLSPMEVHRGRHIGVNGFFNIEVNEEENEISNDEYKKTVEFHKKLQDKRNELVRKRIFNTANRRETSERESQLNVGDYVHVSTYVMSRDNTKVQPNQIKIKMNSEIKLKNPLSYKKRDTDEIVYVKDLKQYPKSLFSSIALKKDKWVWQKWPKDITQNTLNVFVIVAKTPDNRYKLAFIEPQKNDYKWSVYKLESTQNKTYTELFSYTELMKISREDLTDAYKAPIRPDFGFIPHDPKPVIKKKVIQKEIKQIPTSRSAKYVKKDDIEKLFKKLNSETWKQYRSRITSKLSLSNREKIDKSDDLSPESKIQIAYMFSYSTNSGTITLKRDIGYVLGFAKKNINERNRYIFSIYFDNGDNNMKVWNIQLLPSNYGEMSKENGWIFTSVTDHDTWL